MKSKLIVAAVLVTWLLSCSKHEESTQPVKITYQAINKTLAAFSKDSLTLTCYPTYFELAKTGNPSSVDTVGAFIKYPIEIPLCDAGVSFLTTSPYGNIAVFSENETISADDQWTMVANPSLSLVDFKGMGPKFIAFQCSSVSSAGKFPSSGALQHSCYGWIRVQLSADNKTLQIIDMAVNNIANQSLLAGQTK